MPKVLNRPNRYRRSKFPPIPPAKLKTIYGLWRDSFLSMADIARKTGIELSRIKRAAKDGLWPRRLTVRGGQKDRPHKRPNGTYNPHKRKKVIEQEVTSEGIRGVDLCQGSCRWPHGDPLSKNFRFCGKKTHHSLPYCLEHCRVAYEGFAEKDA